MAHNWKSGDVAIGRQKHWVGRVFYVGEDYNGNDGWIDQDGETVGDNGGAPLTDARPLAVIDPEDREQVQRLLARFVEAVDASFRPEHPGGWSVPSMQAALREFANPTPPRPEEPTGLGAVVEDDKGERWIKIDVHVACNDWTKIGVPENPAQGCPRWDYSEIAAVRVLSEGLS